MPDNTLKLKESAVLVPVFRGGNKELRLILIRRSLHGIHSGQLAFPGGKAEDTDASLEYTALREAEEEIGLKSRNVKILAGLPEVDVMASKFRIKPFLAHIIPQKEWVIQESEVSEVLDVSIEELSRPEAHSEGMLQLEEWKEPRRIEFYKVGPYKLWGASYRIFHSLLPRLLKGEFPV
ncbi:MAG: CoA pyrophosphatase [Ignavibacteria bacterium]|nr:CoA pyrophosphatase [Ignavibacteria bacterium]MCU7504917.1 CoA pyrophosphatase [Ignavibacteria bacterium]MCU7517791.1 CoA pyrophosphatase [Ignavibacteria bacterium]